MDLMIRILLVGALVTVAIYCAAQDARAPAPRDHGVAAPAQESRGVVACRAGNGPNDNDHYLVLGNAMDFLLVTDIDTEETTQFFMPEGVPGSYPYGSIMASNNKFYICHGRTFMEFDPTAREWTFHAVPEGRDSAYIGFTEGPDGLIWCGGCPHTRLVSFNPETRELKDHGQMDKAEQYLNTLAVDSSGWVYGGIGTARCNIVACNPATDEMTQMIAEDQRVHGSGSVYPGQDGKVYGTANGRHYRLFEGKADPIEKADAAAAKSVGNIGWGNTQFSLPDGRRIAAYSMPDRYLKVYNPETKETKTITFDYKSIGASITSLAAGPDGNVHGSSCHPMHYFTYAPATDSITDHGGVPAIGGGNFCAITSQGDFIIGAEYAGGRLWLCDPAKPWNPTGDGVRFGMSSEKLLAAGEMEDGRVVHYDPDNTTQIRGNKIGSEAHFKLDAPTDGNYYFYIIPYECPLYCTAQFLFDGKEIGAPYMATSPTYQVGKMQSFGPLDLKAGEHRLTVKLVDSESTFEKYRTTHLWFGIAALEFGQAQLDATTIGYVRNPRVLAQWSRDICRPRTALAHPDGKTVMMAGFAGYGLCGGGIGMYDLAANEELLLTAEKDLLPGHSTITLVALPNGDLVGGTSVGAPGGGHTTATEGEIYILDWETKKVTFRMAPVAGDGNIVSLAVGPKGLVYGMSAGAGFFVFDPDKREITYTDSLAAYGGPVRHALHVGPDGKLYALMNKAIARIDLETFAHEKLTDASITAGGALLNGVLYWAADTRFWSYDVPDLD